MGAYRSAENPDRAKAIAAVALVHLALGALILSGLTVTTVVRHGDPMKVFDISDDVPPPPLEPPPPAIADSPAAKDAAAPANRRATPTDVVAPRQVSLPVPLPMSAALAPGQGTDSSAGASSMRGSGTGAGGEGNGSGGGGAGGSGAGFTPARLVQNIDRRDYRQIAAGRLPQGSAALHIVIGTSGRLTGCTVKRSSGDSLIDTRLCEIAMDELRFQPARDAQGRAIAYASDYMAVWGRR